DRDRALVDHAGAVVDEGDRIVGATVAVRDRASRGQRLAAADVAVVVGLAEVGGVAAVGGQRAAGDRRRRRRAGRAVIGLRIGGRGDGDRALVDHAGGVVDEGDRIVGATVAVVDGAGRGQRLAAADVAVVVGL